VVPPEKGYGVEPEDYPMVCMRFCVCEDEAWVSIAIVSDSLLLLSIRLFSQEMSLWFDRINYAM